MKPGDLVHADPKYFSIPLAEVKHMSAGTRYLFAVAYIKRSETAIVISTSDTVIKHEELFLVLTSQGVGWVNKKHVVRARPAEWCR